ncbi:hypothetical protein EYF80_040283 [Liparis tanakae]|uniref:Uncharacterized protein n=1 Tax=Liparis tanakae TaxID=230148 RepID=A0A4Z2G9A0_9TELE|nr:hypothetical protein EYF80_040283 [Liparis tanakae]
MALQPGLQAGTDPIEVVFDDDRRAARLCVTPGSLKGRSARTANNTFWLGRSQGPRWALGSFTQWLLSEGEEKIDHERANRPQRLEKDYEGTNIDLKI